MGKSYKLECSRCGAHFYHSDESSYATLPTCVGCGESQLERRVVKCPGCQQRLDVSSEEFRRQIIEYIE